MATLLKDSLERRRRSIPLSTGKRVTPKERDVVWFEKIHRHGPLSSSYLHEFTKRLHGNSKSSRMRLADLFHESDTPHGGAYLIRPSAQRHTEHSRYNDAVYALNPRADTVLRERGLLRENVPLPHQGAWKHDFMTSCLTASIELATLQQPEKYRYLFHDEIVDRIGTLRFDVPFSYKNRNGSTVRDERPLIPDRAFGITYPTGTIIFLVEADMSTEPVKTTNFHRKSFYRNLLQYKALIGEGLYKKHFPKGARLVLLNLTTNTRHMQSMMELAEKHADRPSYMLFQNWPIFSEEFRPPKPAPEFFYQHWYRAGHEPFTISAW